MIVLVLIPIAAAASYWMGIQYGKAFSRIEDMKLIEELKKDCVELRKWKADRIGKETP